jgi:ribosome-binding protein aMBF1 (putative translation factor)
MSHAILRRKRKERGWSQAKLGDMVGEYSSLICDLELCEKRGSSEVWRKLSKVLKVKGKVLRQVDRFPWDYAWTPEGRGFRRRASHAPEE